ncbi:divalent metal cation transporter [Bythopirellula goksoeyrii]|uniref:Natural resistance-associated macrophage protein n=1 Tax=Bythopirellula goksoeyrii TaxID=1400387 RepID=A0A5B9QT09_9BACT|nr:divalent metal cation transporter [Bythopirellula goksoeyrii]QEG37241.1 Natural resistance-associated macrophage protein [Bythopirellula goksoeyrii]
MSEDLQLEADRQVILDGQAKGGLAKFLAYTKLSGPGWMQSAMTLGGGSMGSSLYLGILAGVSMIWVQPFAMILGVIMLSAIGYVTLSTGERPFRAINSHINPVLGWSWLLASLMANLVWSMPQYSLCFAVCEQNLFPGIFLGDGILSAGTESTEAGKWLVSIAILVLCTLVTWSYGSGSVGVKIYETVLKSVVAGIVLCFFGVVIRMSMVGDGVDWGAVFSGFIPKFNHLFHPSSTFDSLLNAISDPAARAYWSDSIVSQQRDVMLSAGAAAVGINMTFLLPYTLLGRGWDKDFRGLTIFDLSTGMFIPFVLVTGCVVIAAATQFHAKLPAGCIVSNGEVQVPPRLQKDYQTILGEREAAGKAGQYDFSGEPSLAETELAAVLVKRDTYDLANSLQQLFANDKGEGGRFFSNIVFGIGVVGMTLSSISLMMLISGFVVCEVFNIPPRGWIFRLGCLLSANGAFWPLIWQGNAKAWLTVVAGVFGAMLLPIAYVTFYLMMNQETLLGKERPTGVRRVVWNVLMSIAALAATGAGLSAIMKKGGYTGLGFAAAYIGLVLVVQLMRSSRKAVA